MATNVAERIWRVCEDLMIIQAELSNTAEAEAAKSGGPSPEGLDALRSAVDHMRHFLWCYLEQSPSTNGADMQRLLHMSRVKRTTEMLRALRSQVGPARLAAAPEARSLFEEIEAITERAVQRHIVHGS